MSYRLALLFLLVGCAHRLEAADHPLHQRVAIESGATVHIAEIYDDGSSASLALVDLEGQPTGPFSEERAAAIAAEVRQGIPLEVALAEHLPGAAGACTDEAPVNLATSERPDPRYGRRQVVEFVGEGQRIPLLLLPSGARVELCVPRSDTALVSWEVGSKPTRTRDVQLLDLREAEAKLWQRVARLALEANDRGRAEEALELGRALAPTDPALAYLEARLLAVSGGKVESSLAALERAVRADPPLYRMKARTEPAFDSLREVPAFRELVAPRRLEGTDRIRASRREGPSAAPSR